MLLGEVRGRDCGDDPEWDIVKVFAEYGSEVGYVRSGNMKVRCPLHEDQNPSCSMNAEKGVWKCFSCGEGGGVLRLIELVEGVDYDEARRIAEERGFQARREVSGASRARRGPARPRRPGDGSGAGGGRPGRRGGFRPSWRA